MKWWSQIAILEAKTIQLGDFANLWKFGPQAVVYLKNFRAWHMLRPQWRFLGRYDCKHAAAAAPKEKKKETSPISSKHSFSVSCLNVSLPGSRFNFTSFKTNSYNTRGWFLGKLEHYGPVMWIPFMGNLVPVTRRLCVIGKLPDFLIGGAESGFASWFCLFDQHRKQEGEDSASQSLALWNGEAAGLGRQGLSPLLLRRFLKLPGSFGLQWCGPRVPSQIWI